MSTTRNYLSNVSASVVGGIILLILIFVWGQQSDYSRYFDEVVLWITQPVSIPMWYIILFILFFMYAVKKKNIKLQNADLEIEEPQKNEDQVSVPDETPSSSPLNEIALRGLYLDLDPHEHNVLDAFLSLDVTSTDIRRLKIAKSMSTINYEVALEKLIRRGVMGRSGGFYYMESDGKRLLKYMSEHPLI